MLDIHYPEVSDNAKIRPTAIIILKHVQSAYFTSGVFKLDSVLDSLLYLTF